MCCCVCNLLCKLISLAVSLLFIVAVILLILWGVGVIFKSGDETDNKALQQFREMTYNNPKLL